MRALEMTRGHLLLRGVGWFKPAVVALAVASFALAGRAQPVLPSPLCDSLQVPGGSVLAFHAYAVGVQIYQWTGSAWSFVAPAATLYADPGYHGQVGTHFAGPTWKSNSGSQVVGMRLAACTPDSSAIAWLKLGGISSSGPGVFNGVIFVQRVNTVGGVAPSTAGTTVGQQANVPYAAEYFFYKAAD